MKELLFNSIISISVIIGLIITNQICKGNIIENGILAIIFILIMIYLQLADLKNKDK